MLIYCGHRCRAGGVRSLLFMWSLFAAQVTLISQELGSLRQGTVVAQEPDQPQAAQQPVAVPVAELAAEPVAEAAGQMDVAVFQQVQVFAAEAVELQVAGDVAEGAMAVALGAMGDADRESMKLHSQIAVDNALLRRVCKLNEQQLKQLGELDNNWVQAKVKQAKVAVPAANMAAGVLRIFAGNALAGVPADNSANPADVTKRLSSAHRTKLLEILTADQLEVFELVVKERERFRRAANAECIVALLDDRLHLSVDQRAQLTKSLTAWSGIQKLQAVFYFQNPSYVPQLPAEALKALNTSQRKILEGMQTADFQFEMFDDGEQAICIAQ